MTFYRVLLLCVAFFSCDEQNNVFDPFPIRVDQGTGPVLLAGSTATDTTPVEIAVDVLSPITIFDRLVPGQDPAPSRRLRGELTLWAMTQGAIGVPRVRIPQTIIYNLHPCDRPGRAPELCKVGTDGNTREIFGILGADILTQTSVRFDFAASEIQFFPDTAGSDTERTLVCDAVFANAYKGGGTFLINGQEIRYGATRPTLGACLHHKNIEEPTIDDLDAREIGTDLQMTISTAIGPTLLSQDAYRRYAQTADVPPLEELPTTTVFTPSGAIPARLGQIAFLALTGDVGSDSNGRGPCREMYANARMRTANSCQNQQVDCPCPNNKRSCKAAAIIELNRPMSVAIVPDNAELFQGLRDELRPQVPELDGIIGVDTLLALRVEFDFPNQRLLLRCLSTTGCITRPQVLSQNFLPLLEDCQPQIGEVDPTTTLAPETKSKGP